MKIYNPYEPLPIEDKPTQIITPKKQLNIDTVVLWSYRIALFTLALSTYVLFFYFRELEYAKVIGFITMFGGLLDIIVSLIVVEINIRRSKIDNAIVRNAEHLAKLYERKNQNNKTD